MHIIFAASVSQGPNVSLFQLSFTVSITHLLRRTTDMHIMLGAHWGGSDHGWLFSLITFHYFLLRNGKFGELKGTHNGFSSIPVKKNKGNKTTSQIADAECAGFKTK